MNPHLAFRDRPMVRRSLDGALSDRLLLVKGFRSLVLTVFAIEHRGACGAVVHFHDSSDWLKRGPVQRAGAVLF